MTTSTAVRLDDDIRRALHALAAERAEHHRAPAMAYGVVGDGRLLAAGGIGDPGDGAGRPTSGRSSASRP